MDWPELIEAFLAAKQHAFSPNTRRAYRYDLMACAQLLPTLPICEIMVSHLRLLLDATADLAPRIRCGGVSDQQHYFPCRLAFSNSPVCFCCLG